MRTYPLALAALLAAQSLYAVDSAPSTNLIRRVVNLPGAATGSAPVLLGDRHEYWNDDGMGQFYLMLPAPAATNSAAVPAPDAAATPDDADDDTSDSGKTPAAARPLADELCLSLSALDGRTSNSTVMARSVVCRPLSPKTHFLVDTASLPPGRYSVNATLQVTNSVIAGPAEWVFTRVDKAHKVAAFPAEGIPIEIEKPVRTVTSIPMEVAVPLPRSTVTRSDRLRLEGNGEPVPAQIVPVAQWSPEGALRLVHVAFVARPSVSYRLRLVDQVGETPANQGAVKVLTGEKEIVVDNGMVRFAVNRQRFSGIERAWYDPAGQGRYVTNAPIVIGRPDAGPYLVDGRLIRFSASADKDVRVEVEESGPVKVTIAASGWYTDSQKRPRAAPLCQFKTRITCYANQPAIQVSHHFIITYDTRMADLSDVGFHIPVTEAATFVVGADGAAQTGELPVIPAGLEPNRDGFVSTPGVFLHQDRHDHFRLVQPGKPIIEGRRSDGWAAVGASDVNVTVSVRDIWQKFPKEIELSRQGLTLHFWPAHGHRAFAPADELSLRNLYKFWCFHQNRLLNLTLPPDYFDALTEASEETTECRPAHALNGNGQGLAIGNDFEIRFTARDETPSGQAGLADQAAVFQQAPAGRTPAEWNANTDALGPTAAADTGPFSEVEHTILKGMTSYNASVERGGDYGMWIWPDTHTYWLPAEQRASLHRVWQNSHYHQVGNAWMMWYRGGPFEWLHWTRALNDHYRNVSTINYAELDEAGRARIKFHYPGAMYHCKGCTPWGSEAEGMTRRDTHAGLYGHWTDPDAHLWAWYLDANPRAKDLYDLWLDSVKRRGLLSRGTAREANNTLAMACTAYEATWNADFLPVICGLGKSLLSKPLETQNPGPLWHPLWVNRYVELTRDPVYVPFIMKYARVEWMGNTWNLGMAALAYKLSGDRSFLTNHLDRLSLFPRTLYLHPGDPYDGYGFGPGPLGFGWVEMTWGPFLRALNDAGLDRIAPMEDLSGSAATVPLRYARRGTTAVGYVLKQADRPWTCSFSGGGIDNDMARSTFTIAAPDGTVVLRRDIAQANNPRWKEDIAADGKTGLYRMELNGFGAFRMAATTLDAHAALLTTNVAYTFPRCRAYLASAGKAAPAELTLSAAAKLGDRMIGNAIVRDAAGRELCRTSLCLHFNSKATTLRIDPAVHPQPWLIDLQGAVSLVICSEQGAWILAPGTRDLELMTGPLTAMGNP